MTSLTRVDAQARAELISVDSYAIDLDLTTGAETFGSHTTIRFACARPGGSTFLDVAAHALGPVTLNGVAVDVSALDGSALDGRRLRLDGLAADNEVVVDAVMSYSHDGEGLHRHVDPADGQAYVYAMSFLDAGPRWFACFDQPDLKAPVTLTVRAPQGWTVAGNGPATRGADGRWRLRSAGPLAPYFTTVVAGPYHQLRSEHDGIPLALYARASVADVLDAAAEDLFTHTAACLDELHALFGARYPWGEYHQAFVPEFNAGAMENPGCVTISESLLYRGRTTEAQLVERRTVVAHEMAHMWFGDLVTMRWWDDLWLNESFAEYLGQRVTGNVAWVAFGARRKSWGYAADRRPSTHPVAGNAAADAAQALTAFDGISYAKGASVLRQLAVHLGDDVFLAGLRTYVDRHAHGNAAFADLARAWSDAGAQGLDGWLAAWLRTTGMDELTADHEQVRRAGDTAARAHSVTVAAYAPDGTQLTRRPLTVAADGTPCPAPPDAALVLPDAVDDTWAKTALPPATWEAMPQLLPRLADARTRVVVWNALQLAVADAELAPQRALDVVVAALPAEEDAVLAPVGRWACGTLLGAYLDGDGGRLHDAFAAALRAAPAGSDAQLALARQVVASAVGPAVLAGWLVGRDVPAGLEIDRELRWAVVLRLAQLGAVDAERIAAEAAADASTQGAAHAARCRAALPDPAAKAAAWSAIVGDDARSNAELYALAEGFWVPGQQAVTGPYVARYAAEIASTAQLRSGMVVGRLAGVAFPWTATDRASLELARGVLDAPELDAGIARAVTDAADGLRRAVEARERFGTSS